jgi:hypothetical protein
VLLLKEQFVVVDVVHFLIDLVRKLLDASSYVINGKTRI